MILDFIIRFFQNLFRSFRRSSVHRRMGDSISENKPILVSTNVIVPPIPKLGDTHTYWIWHMLVKNYLKALGLWSRDRPKECAHSKFVILSTVEMWVLRQEYDDFTCVAIFDDLHNRYGQQNRTSGNSYI
ncbi:uncharacterized protein LOC110191218 [Drosophila serrata]|uniref:uncharacterized protein LOC110191218 n=1 Tax=Drosophila serrata TaxID=7274 RepID=UPI000A1D358C|nr:uncharacterized protein LOC110191218 [Drosophila serrata]KAH8361721.1 hypothetical protein KR200_009549 [Drosophila serrata]